MRGKTIEWKDTDWSKSNREIAEEKGTATSVVYRARERLAPETKRPHGYNWSTVDWSKSTEQIVEETGQNQSTVSHARRRYAPDTVGLRSAPTRADWAAVDWSKSSTQIAKETGACASAVSANRKKYAPRTLKLSSREKGRRKRLAKLTKISLEECRLFELDGPF